MYNNIRVGMECACGYTVIAVRELWGDVDVLVYNNGACDKCAIGFLAETSDKGVRWAYGHYFSTIEDAMREWI